MWLKPLSQLVSTAASMYNRLYESELLRDQVKELETALPPNQEFVQSEYWFKKRDTTNLRIPLNADFFKWKRKLFKNYMDRTELSCLLQGEVAFPGSAESIGHSRDSYNIHAHDLESRRHNRYTDAQAGSWVSDWENKASRS